MNTKVYCDGGMPNPFKKPQPERLADNITPQGDAKAPHDPVNHPSHYTSHPSGVECITVTEHMNFNVGNAVKYLWRAGLKGIDIPGNAIVQAAKEQHIQDLKKAQWYISREIERLSK